MCLNVSSRSPGVSSGIQEVSLDVVNLLVCLWRSPACLQVSPPESRMYHCMSPTSWYVSGGLQQVSRCLQQNPGGIIGCHKPRGMSLDISSSSPVSPAECRRYHWRSRTSWYVSGPLQQVSTQLQQNPGGITVCSEHRCMSCKGSSKSLGVSSGIQEVSLDVLNLVVCLWTSPAGLEVSPAESRGYRWM